MNDYSSVSVVIPFYNRSEFIQTCIESIYEQTYPAKEIVIVDDCSSHEESKKLAEIVERIYQPSIPIKIISLPKNAGVSYARNIGVHNASGELIALLDSDDYWDVNKLNEQVLYLNNNPDCSAVHTGIIVFNENGESARYVEKPSRLTITDLLKSSHSVHASVLIKKNIFLKNNGFDTKIRFCEDYDFSIRLVKNNVKIDFIEKPLVFVRRSDHERLTRNNKDFFFGHMRILLKYRSLYLKHEGIFAINRFTAKYLHALAIRIGGIGHVFTLLAFILSPSQILRG